MSDLDDKLKDGMIVAKVGHYSYYAFQNGDIFIKKYSVIKQMKQYLTNSGYMSIIIGGERKLIHRLVAKAYLPNMNNKRCVNHIDGDKLNNAVSNLEWVTYSENMLHAARSGLWQPLRGSKNANAKLTENDVSLIKRRLLNGEKGILLAKEYGVAHGRIYDIKHSKSWVHVTARKAAKRAAGIE